MQPFEQAVADYQSGVLDAAFTLERSDGESFVIPVASYFEKSQLTRIERTALSLCRGHVLDAGAGTGRHSLILSVAGLEVTSIDIVQANVDFMNKMGVPNATLIDLFELSDARFNSILLLNRGLGICSRLERFIPMLHHFATLLEPGGVVIGDSTRILSHASTSKSIRTYIGDVQLRVMYRGLIGRTFDWLYIDESTAAEHARSAGWEIEIQCRTGNDFLAVLRQQSGE